MANFTRTEHINPETNEVVAVDFLASDELTRPRNREQRLLLRQAIKEARQACRREAKAKGISWLSTMGHGGGYYTATLPPCTC